MRRFGHRRGAAAGVLLVVCVLLVAASLASAAWRWASKPRAWRPGEVPVAFWSWRAEAPSEADVRRATEATGAREIFLRAGQFDFADGEVKRVRAVEGKMPRGAELHLVYNATRALLSEFGRVDEKIMAARVAETFRRDREHAGKDGATVRGLQLDFDSPTRLLAHYARVLRAVREQLPPNTKLSVTGLPTWMNAAELNDVLAAVDFWAPQFYGAEIPARFEQSTPISSPGAVAREVERARKAGKPFYAGLAAYGHAIVYDESGALVALRGDLDASRVAQSQEFELVERRAFERRPRSEDGTDAARASEWRVVFRALADTNVDGLALRAGERVVFDLPSGESLRACVKMVREGAGEKLLGILVFRLPTRGDRATLNLRQIAAALADAATETDVTLRATGGAAAEERDAVHSLHDTSQVHDAADARDSKQHDSQDQLVLTATNVGAAGALFGDGALVLTLRVPRGSVRGVAALDGFDSFETLCGAAREGERVELEVDGSGRVENDGGGAGDGRKIDEVDGGRHVEVDGGKSVEVAAVKQVEVDAALRPCSAARAGFVRLKARSLVSGAALRARLSVTGELPPLLAASVSMRVDDGRVWRRARSLELSNRGGH